MSTLTTSTQSSMKLLGPGIGMDMRIIPMLWAKLDPNLNSYSDESAGCSRL
jgi:hypothetical protein